MKKSIFLSFSLLLFGSYGFSQNTKTIEDGGTGPYKAIIIGEKTLPQHSIYRPSDLSKTPKLPVMVWGNGGCANSSEGHQNFLNEIASSGYIILAIGPLVPEGEKLSEEDKKKRTTSNMMLEALDWITAQNNDKTSPYFQKIDIKNVAVAGMSCGGLQTIEVAGDPRFKTAIVMNSGVLNSAPPSNLPGMPSVSKEKLNSFHAPALYVIGDSTDIAYNNAMDDFKRVNHVPIVMTNLNVGHGGTYSKPHGGAFTPLVLNWLDWQLKGKNENVKLFVGQNCYWCGKDGWRVETKNF
jgi:dienelactone hydrolase